MKILVVSLLRLGDIIQQFPLLRGLRAQYPEAEIHLLINQQFLAVQDLLRSQHLVDRFVCLDRVQLQRGLVEPGFNISWSAQKLEKFCEGLQAEKYDLAYNFTHNKLSAYLLGALDLAEVKGLIHTQGKFRGLENSWLRYFNERFSGVQRSLFNYVELLANSFDIPVQPPQIADSRVKSKLILFQPLTSDIKKNWGLKRFLELKQEIESSLRDYQVKILGAEFEKDILSSVFSPDDLLICSLAQAQEHLQQAALLVTGDTSIKHLAAELGVPVVEIALGSADPVKTGALGSHSRIIKSSLSCAPCSHSKPCPLATHECAASISLDQVYTAVWDQLSGEQYRQGEPTKDLERAVWSSYLNQKTVSQEVVENLRQLSLEQIQNWRKLNERYFHWLCQAEVSLRDRQYWQSKIQLQRDDLGDLVSVAQDILKSGADTCGYFQGYIDALLSRFSHPVQVYEKVYNALEEIRKILIVRKTIEPWLSADSKEGDYYAKGIGQLSVEGFVDAGKSPRGNSPDAEL